MKGSWRIPIWSVAVGLFAVILLVAPMSNAGRLVQEQKYPNIVTPERVLGMYGIDTGQLIKPRGVAFGDDGRVYVADCDNHRVQVFDTSGLAGQPLGRHGFRPGEFVCPSGIAIRNGEIYVADTGNDRIQVFDIAGRFLRLLGRAGRVPLEAPEDLVFGPRGVYAVSPLANRVYVYDRSGNLLLTFGGPGERPGQFARAQGIAVDATGHIFVADMYNNRIQKFSPAGEFVQSWGKLGTFNGQLAAPSDLALAASGELFVADSVNHRIHVFDTHGKYQYQFGRHPVAVHEGDGHLHYPMVLAAHPKAPLLVVCEKFESRCQLFDTAKARQRYKDVNQTAWWEKYPYFHYRSSIEISFPNTRTGRVHDVAVISEEELHRVMIARLNESGATTLRTIGTYGSGPGQLKMANGANLDPEDNIWISDTMNHRLQVFNWDGKLIRTIGGPGSGRSQFLEPGSIQIDSQGTVYVADTGNNRIQVLDRNGNFVRQWGTYGTRDGQLVHPIYISLDRKEQRIYVLDITPRIQVFDIHGRFIDKWGSYGIGPGQFKAPLKIATGPDGMVYVCDEALNRITKFSPEGKFVMSWGHRGSGPAEFFLPQGIDVDSKNRVWVIDYGNHRGQTFTTTGAFLFAWGEGEINTLVSGATTWSDFRSGAAGAALGSGLALAVVFLGSRRRLRGVRSTSTDRRLS